MGLIRALSGLPFQENFASLYSFQGITILIFSIIVSNFIFTVVYNLYFHPLADFPGPLLGRSWLIWRWYHMLSGKSHLAIEKLHRQYGPIVRIAPNELSFGSVESLKAIYGHNPGKPHPKRGSFYNFLNAGFSKFNLVSEPDPHRHGEMRKLLLPAFSQRALLEQEQILGAVVDQWLKALEEKAGPGTQGANITRWYDFGSFDVLGELAFGESFHAVETEKLDTRLNLAINPYFITFIDNIRHIKLVTKLFTWLVPSSVFLENPNSRFSREQVEKRLALDESRQDFVFPLAQKVRSGEMDKEEMASNMFVFSVAGQDTTSVALAATTYLLLKHPEKLKLVVAEIREAFNSYKEINAQDAQQLRYLQAVINESLRILPPVSAGHALPRWSHGFELHERYIPPGVELFSSPWTITHDPKYFKDPMEFKPERWLDPTSTDLKEASQPFSIGPNACIGKSFSWMEQTMFLTKILWAYDLELVNKDVDWVRDGQVFVAWSKPNLFIRFHPRPDGNID